MEKPQHRKLILFDIDGTLLLTGGAGKAAFDRCFAELYGLGEAWRDIHPDGRTDPSLIEELFEKNFQRKPSVQERTQVQDVYTAAMETALQSAERFRLMPGIVELLTRIEQRRLGLVGLATGNFEATAWQKLRRAQLEKFFSFGGFGSDHEDRLTLTRIAVERGKKMLQRNVKPEDVVLVGDTCRDIECGRRLGLVTLAVATGSTPHEQLAQARPDFLYRDFSDLDAVACVFE
jgi:Predicted phosphatases